MADYDSDSSGAGDDVETNVLLGYASKEPTLDDFSQLGGQPTWLDQKTAPSGAYAKCKVCNGVMSLLLQLYGDLPDWFPGHERRLYVFGCKRKACRRKVGSIRALRAIRANKEDTAVQADGLKANGEAEVQPTTNIGETLFSVKSPTPAQANPFISSSSSTPTANPFSAAKPTNGHPASTPQSTINGLAESFAQKASISSETQPSVQASPPEPWSDDPSPFPTYYVDVDKEYLEREDSFIPSNARLDNDEGGSSAADEKAAFESSLDKTFQKFADRLAQNPEQVLRYEFAGNPLLYAKNDAVGKLLAPGTESRVQTSTSRNGNPAPGSLKIPRCTSCGAARMFELQLTPHAIAELEAEDMSVEGMDWGTIIVGVCSSDCREKGKAVGEVGYLEEWVGVQWE